MPIKGVTAAMTAAHSALVVARRFDQKHGTSTRDDLPADVRRLAREYKRLQMQDYRGREGAEAGGGHLLSEDGIVDLTAVEIAVQGSRVVNMTQRERVLAVRMMEQCGLSQREMQARLGLADFTVYYLRQSAARMSDAEFKELTAA